MTGLLAHKSQKYSNINVKTKLEMFSRKRKDTSWLEKNLTTKLLSSMNINVNANILNYHNNATDIGMEGQTGKISQTSSKSHPQQTPCTLQQEDNLH